MLKQEKQINSIKNSNMKTKSIILAALIGVSAMSFTDKSTEYKVDANKSKVTWTGRKVVGEHTGNVRVSDGKLLVTGSTFTGGTFVIDMASITNTDLTDATYNEKLVGHLKSDDFFSTAKFPKATLVVKSASKTGADQYNVKGDLTIKGITNPVEFPATVKISGKEVSGRAKIMIDRTKYDIKYGSGSFFDNLGDKAIDNMFELNVDLVATK
jgi:polyisoprenoid-binding protein YceI